MAIRIAKRMAAVGASPTLAITAKAKALQAEGKSIVSFGAGEPDFDTPEPAKDACIAALKAGFTKYTAAGGIPELKNAIVAKFKRDNGLDYKPSQVIVTCGGKHACYASILSVIDDGDEVLIPVPYWVTYPEIVNMAGGKSVFVPTLEKDGFRLRPEAIEKALSPRTRLLILNSPCNPTGAVLEKEDLEAIAAIARAKDLVVLSDEIYEPMTYGGRKHLSIANLDGMKDRTIIVNGASKAYSMTGWRIGYTAGPQEVISAMDAQISHSTSNVTSFAQKGAVAALGLPPEVVGTMVKAFDERRAEIVRLLNDVPGIRCLNPGGAFYVFPNVEGTYGTHKGRSIQSSEDLTNYLLEIAGVAVVHGEAFGAPGFIRLSYATSMESIREGVRRIKESLTA
jgi:aspartate aminotransferase